VARSDNRERVLSEDGPLSKRLVVKLAQYEDSRILDLRYWYLDKKSGEFRQTPKGVSLTRKNFLLLKRIVDDHSELVLDWLGISYVPNHITAYETRQADKAEEIRVTMPKTRIRVHSDRRSAGFFDVNFEGGDAEVSLNTAHSFVGRFLAAIDGGDKEKAKNLLGQLLLGYASAAEGLSGATATSADILLDQLEFDWSQTLKSAGDMK
jgi:Transcriptional Coactivator p15 (PC4)